MCEECAEELLGDAGVQAKLSMSQPDDPFEREADAVADRIMSNGSPQLVETGRASSILRSASFDAAPSPTPSIASLTRGGGMPLPDETLNFFEPRFGRRLDHVRVHDDSASHKAARNIGARAFTHGSNIYFADGEFDAESDGGRHLLAHELTHVFQQGRPGRPDVQCAQVRIGQLTIEIDYGPVASVAVGDYASRALAELAKFTGTPATAADQTAVSALGSRAQRWLLFALNLHSTNIRGAATLNRATAATRLIARAPKASTEPVPDPDALFVHEALEASGWLETALGARLARPSVADRAAINLIVNPPPTSGSATDPLNAAELQKRLEPALRHYLTQVDPAKWTSTGRHSISALQAIGDIIQAEAKSFFSPYADAAAGNVYALNPPLKAASIIFDTVPVTPSAELRRALILNRSEVIGRSTSKNAHVIDANIFADVHFDASRDADRVELERVVTPLLTDPTIGPIVDRLVQHTGRQFGQGANAKIGLSGEYNAATQNACQAHWAAIRTICHEILHALVNPDFYASNTRFQFPQVIREGFTEVLGVQLYNDRVLPKAASDPAFKASIESGVTGAPCPAPANTKIGYGSAGAGADAIRRRVGDANFRAAYFLGRTDLAGLP